MSFSLHPGELVLIASSYSSGASTLLSLLSSEHPNVHLHSPSLPVCIGVCPGMLSSSLTPYQHLRFFAALSDEADGRVAAAVMEALYDLGLVEQLHRPTGQLSDGDGRVLCFLLTLLTPASLYLLDDPFAGVDERRQQRLLSLLRVMRDVRRGNVVLLACKDVEAVEPFVDRLMILERGHLVVLGDLPFVHRVLRTAYHLTVDVKGTAVDGVLRLVQRHVEDAHVEEAGDTASTNRSRGGGLATIVEEEAKDVEAAASTPDVRRHTVVLPCPLPSPSPLPALMAELIAMRREPSSPLAGFAIESPSLAQACVQWARLVKRERRGRRSRRAGDSVELSLSLSASRSASYSSGFAWDDGLEDDDSDSIGLDPPSEEPSSKAAPTMEATPPTTSVFVPPAPIARSLSASSLSSLSSLLPSSFLSPASPVLKASRQARAMLTLQWQLTRRHWLSSLMLLSFPPLFAFLVLLLIGSLSFSPSSSPPSLPLYPTYARYEENVTLAQRLNPHSPYARLFASTLLPYQSSDLTLLPMKALMDYVAVPTPFPVIPSSSSSSPSSLSSSSPYAPLLDYLLSSDAPSYAALYASEDSPSAPSNASLSLHLTLFHNSSSTHASALTINLLYSALLQQMCDAVLDAAITQSVHASPGAQGDEEGVQCGIRAANHPLPFPSSTVLNDASTLIVTLLLALAFSLLPVHFASLFLADRLSGRLSHYRAIGLKPGMYYGAHFVYSFLCYLGSTAAVFALFALGDVDWLLSFNGGAAFALFLLFGGAAIAHATAVSLWFRSTRTFQVAVSLLYGVVTVIAFITALSLSIRPADSALSFISAKSAPTSLSSLLKDDDVFGDLERVVTGAAVLGVAAVLPPFALMWGAMELGVENVRRGRREEGVAELMGLDKMGGVLLALLLCWVVSALVVAVKQEGWDALIGCWRRVPRKDDDARDRADATTEESDAEEPLSTDALLERRRVHDVLREGNVDPVLFYDVSGGQSSPSPSSSAITSLMSSACHQSYTTLRPEDGDEGSLSHVTVGLLERETVSLYSPASTSSSSLVSLLLPPSRPTSGRILLDGVDVSRAASEIGRKLGVAEDGDPSDESWLTCREACALYGRMKGMAEDAIDARGRELMDALGVRPGRMVRECGDGERRRLRVVLALLSSPRVLLIRGVTGALSDEEADAVWRVCRAEMAQRDRLLLIDDPRRRASRHVDRAIMLHQGALHRVVRAAHTVGWCLVAAMTDVSQAVAALREEGGLRGMRVLGSEGGRLNTWWGGEDSMGMEEGSAVITRLMTARETAWGVRSWRVRRAMVEDQLAVAEWETV